MSQVRSQLQRAVSRQRQAIDAYNREVRKVNQQRRLAVDRYNQVVRAHNAEVHARRTRLLQAIRSLERRSRAPVFERVRVSAESLHGTFLRLEASNLADRSALHAEFVERSETEATNSLAVAHEFLTEDEGTPKDHIPESLRESGIVDDLRQLSPDLEARWAGALFALHPHNPDAARHFCTSARDTIDRILQLKAPADDVLAFDRNCELTKAGGPTRRSQIRFLLSRRGLLEAEAERFASEDADNIVGLFRDFNDGTHGRPGRFVLSELLAIKRRVEESVKFLLWIAA